MITHRAGGAHADLIIEARADGTLLTIGGNVSRRVTLRERRAAPCALRHAGVRMMATTLNNPAPPHVVKLREEIAARLKELDALTKANAAAPCWGAALTARNERIAALTRELTTIAIGRASFHNLTRGGV